MKSIADQLPPEIARQIHPDRRKNEAAYWAVRDQLLDQYQGQWIGFADGRVVASGTSPVTVFHAAEATGLHPFFICVGREEEPCRIRRATFPYDASYPGEALPVISVEFRQASGSPWVVLDRVIPDTGADASVLPWADCQLLQLTPASGVQGLISGVAGSSAATLAFLIWAWLDGREYPCRLQADFVGSDRILGRDVLNRLEVLFRGPSVVSRSIVRPAPVAHSRIDDDFNKIDDAVLALLYLGLHDGARAWKGLDWEAMNRLHEHGYITDPRGKAKSVVFAEEGLERAKRLLEELFSKVADRVAGARCWAPAP